MKNIRIYMMLCNEAQNKAVGSDGKFEIICSLWSTKKWKKKLTITMFHIARIKRDKKKWREKNIDEKKMEYGSWS